MNQWRCRFYDIRERGVGYKEYTRLCEEYTCERTLLIFWAKNPGKWIDYKSNVVILIDYETNVETCRM